MKRVTLYLPTGSLKEATLRLVEEAISRIRVSPRGNTGSIQDERIELVRFIRPQHAPWNVARHINAVAICGEDCTAESGEDVLVVTELSFSKNTAGPVRVVLFADKDNPCQSIADVPDGSTILTEYLELTEKLFRKLGKKVEIRFSHGSTEAEVPSGFDFGVTVVETGASLKENRLKIVEVIMESSTVLICNPMAKADPELWQSIQEIALLLKGVLDARGKVLLSLNVAKVKLEAVLAVITSMKKPTIGHLTDPDYFSVSSVVLRADLPVLIPKLLQAGAEDLVEIPIAKAIHSW